MSNNPARREASAQDLGECVGASRPAGLVNFYHLTSAPLERSLPKLLEKAYNGGFRVILMADETRLEKLNELLWTYDQDSFLPHGTKRDGDAAIQPIYLTSPSEDIENVVNKNNSIAINGNIFLITNGYYCESTEDYSRIIDIFDGDSEESLSAARSRWKQYKQAGCEMNYYQQTNSGGWEKKNV